MVSHRSRYFGTESVERRNHLLVYARWIVNKNCVHSTAGEFYRDNISLFPGVKSA